MRIERHAIADPERVRHKFAYSCERLSKILGYCQNRSASLYGAIGAAWDIILCGSVVQPDSPEIRRSGVCHTLGQPGQRPPLDLPHPLARQAEPVVDLLERLGLLPVQAEAR
jgi:hypothetical protein